MSLYDDVLEIAREYMGIAAKDYIDRRCRIVLRGEAPETITTAHLDRLVVGVGMTAKGYIGERKTEDFKSQLEALKKRG